MGIIYDIILTNIIMEFLVFEEGNFFGKGMIKRIERNLGSFMEKSKILFKLDGFLNGRVFIALLAVFIFVVQFMGWDLIGFGVLSGIFFFVNLFCYNNRVSFSIVCMAIFCVSTQNSPNLAASGFRLLGKCEYEIVEASTFYSSKEFFDCATICSGIVAFAVIYRLLFFGNFKKLFKPNSLVWGLICIAIAFALSGRTSEDYNKSDFYFGLIQAGTFLIIYMFFATTQRKENFTFDYVANLLITIFVYMIALLIYLYATRFEGFMHFSSKWKDCLTPGWGWSLDIGTYLTLGIAVLFYKIYKGKRVAMWFTLIVVGVVALFFSLSRGAILSTVALILIGFVGAFFKKEIRWKVLLCTLIATLIISVIVTILIRTDNSKYFFDYFLERGFADWDSGRFKIWKQFWDFFEENKVFGVGFDVKLKEAVVLENGIFAIYSLLAHNVLLQMLGSCGIIGFVALAIHLIQVCLVCFDTKDKNKKFFTLAIFTFLFMSMLDTIFFKAQFTFVYLGLLLVCELSCEKEKEKLSRKG